MRPFRILIGVLLAFGTMASLAPPASAHYCNSGVDDCGPCDGLEVHLHFEGFGGYRCSTLDRILSAAVLVVAAPAVDAASLLALL